MTLEKDNGTFGVVVRGGSHDVPLRCRPFTVVQVKMVIGQVKMMFSWTMMIVRVEMLLTWIMLVLSQHC